MMDNLTFEIISTLEMGGYTCHELKLDGYSKSIGVKIGSSAIWPMSTEAFTSAKAKMQEDRIAELEAKLAAKIAEATTKV